MLELETIGELCQRFQTGIPSIRRAAERAGVKAVVTVNGVEHFAANTTEEIRLHLKPHAQRGPVITPMCSASPRQS